MILSDSAYMYSIMDNKYLVFELFSGSSLQKFLMMVLKEDLLVEINQFIEITFHFMKLVFDMSSFDLKRTKGRVIC